MTFTQVTTRLKIFLMAWLLVLGLEEALVECTTMCIKSWVKLRNINNNDGGNWAGDGSKIGKNCQRIVSKNWRHGRRGYQKSRKCQRQLWMVPKTFMCIINILETKISSTVINLYVKRKRQIKNGGLNKEARDASASRKFRIKFA